MPEFENAWRKVEEQVARYCRRQAVSDDEAKELLQRVCVRALRGHARYRGDRGDASYLRWALKIAKNEVADFVRQQIRQRAREITTEDISDKGGGDAATDDPSTSGNEDLFLSRLLSEARQAGALSQVDVAVLNARLSSQPDLGWRSIAPSLGITPANAAQLHARAVARLRVYCFLAMPDILGGEVEIRKAFKDCEEAQPESGYRLTAAEANAFRCAVLERREDTVSQAQLRSACQKVIKLLPSLI